MTGNDLHARRKLCDYVGNILRKALNIAAAIQIHKRKLPGEEMVAHVDYIRVGEEYDAVAVGVPLREVNHPDLFAVEMNR
jgi:hypothetical protein